MSTANIGAYELDRQGGNSGEFLQQPNQEAPLPAQAMQIAGPMQHDKLLSDWEVPWPTLHCMSSPATLTSFDHSQCGW